jgi:hypothetical protein
LGRQIGRMKTIYTAGIVSDGVRVGDCALSGGGSDEVDEVHRRPGRLCVKGDHSAGGDTFVRDGFMALSVVVKKYLPENSALTLNQKGKPPYITDN